MGQCLSCLAPYLKPSDGGGPLAHIEINCACFKSTVVDDVDGEEEEE